MDQIDLYAMIIYMIYYVLVVFELLLFSFADTSVLPQADDPQVCVIWLSLIICFYLSIDFYVFTMTN